MPSLGAAQQIGTMTEQRNLPAGLCMLIFQARSRRGKRRSRPKGTIRDLRLEGVRGAKLLHRRKPVAAKLLAFFSEARRAVNSLTMGSGAARNRMSASAPRQTLVEQDETPHITGCPLRPIGNPISWLLSVTVASADARYQAPLLYLMKYQLREGTSTPLMSYIQSPLRSMDTFFLCSTANSSTACFTPKV